MDNNIKVTLSEFFTFIWQMLNSTSLAIPGTNILPIHLIVAPLGAVAFITVLKKVLDIGGVSSTQIGVINRVNNKKKRKEGDK